MKKKLLVTASGVGLWMLPIAAFASGCQAGSTEGLCGVINVFGNILNLALPVVVAFALIAFFWGLAIYIFNFSGKDEDKKKGRNIMVYGIIILFVIVSVWGIVNILRETFNINNNNNVPTIPTIPTGGTQI